MNFNIFHKENDKLFISKLVDRLNYAICNNKISHTDFMNSAEIVTAKKVLASLKVQNYIFYGAYEFYERCILIFYPEKFNKSIVESNYNNILGIIRIELPKEQYGKYTHRDYLGGITKLGITREKIGDILVFENGADIIVKKSIIDFLISNLQTLTRFQKSKISQINIEDLRIIKPSLEEIKITIPSLRLDAIVAELAHTSRNKACELISEEKVIVNYNTATKTNLAIKENDIITIRHTGKYIIGNKLGNTKKGNILLNIKKYK